MPLLVYTLLRAGLVVAAGGLLYLVGLRDVLLVGVAVVVGALLSYLLLPGQRRAAAARLQTIAEREPARVRPDGDALAEDAALDEEAVPDAGGSPERQRGPDRDGER